MSLKLTLNRLAWLEAVRTPVARRADGRALVLSLAVGVSCDLAVRSGVVGVAGSLAVTTAAIALVASARLLSRQAVALAALAPIFAGWLSIRATPWLAVPNLLAAGGLLVAAASLSRSGTVLDLSVPRWILRAVHATYHVLAAPSFALTGHRTFGLPVVRGILLATPVLLAVGALLASADAVFASFIDPQTVGSHLVVVILGAWAGAGLLRLSSVVVDEPPTSWRPRIGAVEAIVVTGSLCILYGVFAAAQALALTQGGRRVLETAGLTYAEYARTGFFQLLGAAFLTTAVLMAVRASTEPAHPDRRVVAASAGAASLTLLVCAVAFQRLVLYERAFGLTMPRLYAQVAVVWIAIVLVLLVVQMVRSARAWLPAAAAAAGLVLLVALNLLNPEAFVAERNIDHAHTTGRFDPRYAATLSSDATPVLVKRSGELSARDRTVLRSHLVSDCDAEERSLAGVNRARIQARAALREMCPTP